jgi:transposase-like protein
MKSKRKFSREFKQAAIRQMAGGKSAAEVARALEVHPSDLYRWRRELNEHGAEVGLSLLAVSLPASAHHSFQAEYDQSKPLTLVGKVTNVVADNPHGWIYLDAKHEQGKVVNWALELPPPNVLRRNGFDRSIYERSYPPACH